MLKHFLVAICKKHTHETVALTVVQAADRYYAVHLAFHTTMRDYSNPRHWGDATEITESEAVEFNKVIA